MQAAAVAAAEAIAASAAAQVAAEAAATAQAAVETASAAASKAAARAREVAARALSAAAAAAGEQVSPLSVRTGESTQDVVGATSGARVGARAPAGPGRMSGPPAPGVDSAAAAADKVARRVEAVAAAAATAVVDAAAVIQEQLASDVAAAAAAVTSAQPGPLDRARESVPLGAAQLVPESGSGLAQPKRNVPSASVLTDDVATTRELPRQVPSPHTISAALIALHHAERDLEEAQRLGGLGSWSWTVATDEVVWSDHMYRLFGVEPQQFVPTYAGFLEHVHPEDRELVSESVASVLAGAAGYEFDHRVIRPTGEVLWLHARGAVVRDEHGAPVRLHGTSIDRTASELAAQREREQLTALARLASHDGLTGLGNRTLLHDRLDDALAHHGGLSVLLLDLDNFKAVNDVSGHAGGDRLLVEVANRLLLSVGAGDTVARLGGDEFAIVVEQGDPGQLAQRILGALSVPVTIGNRQVVPNASVGIASSDGTVTTDELLVRADAAMYAAKAAGKGRALQFDAVMASEVRLRASLHEGLREAVARGEIVVHYQPIIDVQRQSMSRVEALVRWQRPDGLVAPAQFLPLAEETGLIVGIGEEVLRQTCAQMGGWLTDNGRRSVSVNVSPVQLAESDFAERVLAVIADAAVDPRQVVLEVTETLFLSTTPFLIERLNTLRRHGIHISIDDFGTGYSSLGRLRSLPIDSIKIDKSFVDLIGSGGRDEPIVTSMIVMAHALGLDVTAEGVETSQQAARLVALGCDYLQGFHFARPQPASTVLNSAADGALLAWRAVVQVKDGDAAAQSPVPPW